MDKQTKSGMPVDESKYSFTIPRTDEPREKILKLGAMITDRIGKVTGNDPEYWGLAGVVTDEMADVALKMKVRKPKTTAQIAALTGKSEEELEKLLTEMSTLKEKIHEADSAYKVSENEIAHKTELLAQSNAAIETAAASTDEAAGTRTSGSVYTCRSSASAPEARRDAGSLSGWVVQYASRIDSRRPFS